MIKVFPRALSNLKLSSKALGQHMGPDWVVFVLNPQHHRQHIKTIRGIFILQLIANNGCQCSENIRGIGHLL